MWAVQVNVVCASRTFRPSNLYFLQSDRHSFAQRRKQRVDQIAVVTTVIFHGSVSPVTVRHISGEINTMKISSRIRVALVMATLALATTVTEAGDLFHHGRRAGCDCNGSPARVAYAPPVVTYAEPASFAPVVENACACTSAAASCCGLGGGMMQLGSVYGAGSMYSGVSGHHGSPAVGSFLSGYEGLPNMDGGGIHHRYPYHSYRRPWAHPGTPSTNVTIVW